MTLIRGLVSHLPALPTAAVVVVAVLAVGVADAMSITVAGYEFSDEKGGFTLLSATGEGTREDPFVVVEEVYGNGPAVLVIRPVGWLSAESRYDGELAIRLRKVVINRSGFSWGLFRLELREQEEQSSDYYDGLSFDQTDRLPRPFKSDVFRHIDEDLEPVDSVTFSAGMVDDGAAMAVEVSITDLTPVSEFYLRQSMNQPVSRLSPADPAEIAVAFP